MTRLGSKLLTSRFSKRDDDSPSKTTTGLSSYSDPFGESTPKETKRRRFRLGKHDIAHINKNEFPKMQSEPNASDDSDFIDAPLTGRSKVKNPVATPRNMRLPHGLEKTQGDQDIKKFLKNEKLTMKAFRVRKIIGKGTFGTVQVVTFGNKKVVDGCLRLPPFAIKSMKKSVLVHKGQIDHVRDEFRILNNSESVFIVKFYGFFQDEYYLHFLQEYVIGGELFNRIAKSGGGLKVDECRFYFAEVACAMEYLHNRSVVYRDLKPENILINHDGHIKMIDFGFAKDLSNTPDNLAFTLCGTPEYLAPEILQTEKGHSFAADNWALGVLLFEMLTGGTPFKDTSTPMDLYTSILQSKVVYPDGMDQAAVNIIQRLLRKDASSRLNSPGKARIKDHKFLTKAFTWEKVQSLKLTPPWKPVTNGPCDSCNFLVYPEEPKQLEKVSKSYDDIFATFDAEI